MYRHRRFPQFFPVETAIKFQIKKRETEDDEWEEVKFHSSPKERISEETPTRGAALSRHWVAAVGAPRSEATLSFQSYCIGESEPDCVFTKKQRLGWHRSEMSHRSAAVILGSRSPFDC